MVLITRKDIEALQNGDLCFVENPKTGELLSALYYDSDGSRDIGSSGYWVRPCQYNSRGLRRGDKNSLINNIIYKHFTITNKRD